MLIVTIGWLVSVLAAQSATKEIWHWILYILAVLFILFFRHLLKIEVDKLDEHRELIPRLHRRFDIFFGVVLFGIFIFSGWDVVSTAKQRQQLIQDTKFSMIDEQEIRNAVDQGHKVLVKVGADWCLTCKYNDAFVFEATSIAELLEKHQVAVYEVDWTHYDAQVLHFMQKYGRAGLPFYVLFSPKFSEGIVLPELPDVYELETLLEM
jgi:thiol:disulfide interchange protein